MSSSIINYWPIVNDLNDYIGNSDMTTGPLDANETIGFTLDRFNNPNGAIYMNPGYYVLPPSVYFYSTFSFLVWVKVLVFNPWSRIIDCGNGPDADNIIVVISYDTTQIPYTQIYQLANPQGLVNPPDPLTANTWYHLAVVYDGVNLKMYLNGVLSISLASGGPNIVQRSQCFIGRSNYHVSSGDSDASACFDDIMLFNRALSSDEILNLMNYTLT